MSRCQCLNQIVSLTKKKNKSLKFLYHCHFSQHFPNEHSQHSHMYHILCDHMKNYFHSIQFICGLRIFFIYIFFILVLVLWYFGWYSMPVRSNKWLLFNYLLLAFFPFVLLQCWPEPSQTLKVWSWILVHCKSLWSNNFISTIFKYLSVIFVVWFFFT